jgi:hypothetical protein
MTHVVIKLTLEAALDLHAGRATAHGLTNLLQVAREMGVHLAPLHPGTTHPLLAPFFTVNFSDEATAQSFIARLSGNPVVIAAYTEPAVGPP